MSRTLRGRLALARMNYVSYVGHMTHFGRHVMELRKARQATDRAFSLRQVAGRIGLEPSYLSKVERGGTPPPSEQAILRLAADLGEDPNVLLASAGKVSAELQQIILRRPQLFAEFLQTLKNAPDDAVYRVLREVRDGEW